MKTAINLCISLLWLCYIGIQYNYLINLNWMCDAVELIAYRLCITCSHNVVAHNFVSITCCLHASCRWLGSVGNVLSCVTGNKPTGLLSRLASVFVATWCLLEQHKPSACLNSGIRNAYTIGLRKELEYNRRRTISSMHPAIGETSMTTNICCTIITGSQDSKARRDTNNKVFVKRLFCEVLFCCCETILPC